MTDAVQPKGPNGGPYRLVAAPSSPIYLAALPTGVIDVLSKLQVTFAFESCQTVTGEMLATIRSRH